ncbi:predicted protein [Histoplasma capsulatum G186AR]|uniref:Uncharacterized protein n=2 Tax=Ajellomyces capsulatus TaxID=5037 RepID=C0P092_AJECG|nr:uncharacterized protein HCBG_08811 [Histoplasma capsulatum G186AR]EEH02908.1 predicted protein [Histoplasma capsulatum G186AR]KAG5295979.1 hypothetical protein I7I52_06435 [Histoplasma capsulatum]QSS73962.1 hypothetical protein I7I50_08919 [Histoplasma capsulatum G186AR]
MDGILPLKRFNGSKKSISGSDFNKPTSIGTPRVEMPGRVMQWCMTTTTTTTMMMNACGMWHVGGICGEELRVRGCVDALVLVLGLDDEMHRSSLRCSALLYSALLCPGTIYSFLLLLSHRNPS